jgi:hypothetical protein
MTDSEKFGEKVVMFLAVIGVISIFSFVPALFNKDNASANDTDEICGTYTSKIEDLESEINYLNDEIRSLENLNNDLGRELELTIEERNEYMEYYEEKEGIEYPKLTDGPSREN